MARFGDFYGRQRKTRRGACSPIQTCSAMQVKTLRDSLYYSLRYSVYDNLYDRLYTNLFDNLFEKTKP